jgi:hypothetical protein
MTIFTIETSDDKFDFEGDITQQLDGILEVLKDHRCIAAFRNWECWYEKIEKKEENCNSAR